MLEQTANTIENQVIGKLETALDQWRSQVLTLDGILVGLLAALTGIALTVTDSWHLLKECIDGISTGGILPIITIMLLLGVIGYIHFAVRKSVARSILKQLPQEFGHDHNAAKQFSRAFSKSTAGYRPMFLKKPAGWNGTNRRILAEVKEDANDYIQMLNDQFTDPSGHLEQEQNQPATEQA